MSIHLSEFYYIYKVNCVNYSIITAKTSHAIMHDVDFYLN